MNSLKERLNMNINFMHALVTGKVCNMLNFLIEKMMTYASISLDIKITHILENINTVKKTKQCDFVSPFDVMP